MKKLGVSATLKRPKKLLLHTASLAGPDKGPPIGE
jgi:hypothetical protein